MEAALPSNTPAEARFGSPGARLRALIARPQLTIVTEAPAPQMARVAEALGHECLYTGGGMLSRWHLVVEDWGLIQQGELARLAGEVARAVSVPVIADADQGGETPLNTWKSVRDFEREGVAGVHIEDSVNPKYINVPSAARRAIEVPQAEMLERIAAAVEGRRDPGFVIIARTDVLVHAEEPAAMVDAVIARAHAYKEAGADVFMPVGMDEHLVARVSADSPLPVFGLGITRRQAEGTRLRLSLFQTHDPLIALYEHMARDLMANGELPDLPLPTVTVGSFPESDALREIARRWFAADSRYRP